MKAWLDHWLLRLATDVPLAFPRAARPRTTANRCAVVAFSATGLRTDAFVESIRLGYHLCSARVKWKTNALSLTLLRLS